MSCAAVVVGLLFALPTAPSDGACDEVKPSSDVSLRRCAKRCGDGAASYMEAEQAGGHHAGLEAARRSCSAICNPATTVGCADLALLHTDPKTGAVDEEGVKVMEHACGWGDARLCGMRAYHDVEIDRESGVPVVVAKASEGSEYLIKAAFGGDPLSIKRVCIQVGGQIAVRGYEDGEGCSPGRRRRAFDFGPDGWAEMDWGGSPPGDRESALRSARSFAEIESRACEDLFVCMSSEAAAGTTEEQARRCLRNYVVNVPEKWITAERRTRLLQSMLAELRRGVLPEGQQPKALTPCSPEARPAPSRADCAALRKSATSLLKAAYVSEASFLSEKGRYSSSLDEAGFKQREDLGFRIEVVTVEPTLLLRARPTGARGDVLTIGERAQIVVEQELCRE